MAENEDNEKEKKCPKCKAPLFVVENMTHETNWRTETYTYHFACKKCNYTSKNKTYTREVDNSPAYQDYKTWKKSKGL